MPRRKPDDEGGGCEAAFTFGAETPAYQVIQMLGCSSRNNFTIIPMIGTRYKAGLIPAFAYPRMVIGRGANALSVPAARRNPRLTLWRGSWLFVYSPLISEILND
jgi:hypothetical protein